MDIPPAQSVGRALLYQENYDGAYIGKGSLAAAFDDDLNINIYCEFVFAEIGGTFTITQLSGTSSAYFSLTDTNGALCLFATDKGSGESAKLTIKNRTTSSTLRVWWKINGAPDRIPT